MDFILRELRYVKEDLEDLTGFEKLIIAFVGFVGCIQIYYSIKLVMRCKEVNSQTTTEIEKRQALMQEKQRVNDENIQILLSKVKPQSEMHKKFVKSSIFNEKKLQEKNSNQSDELVRLKYLNQNQKIKIDGFKQEKNEFSKAMKKMTTEKCGLQAKIDFLKGDFETRQNDLSDNYNDQIKKLQDENCSLKKGLNKISKNYEVLHKKKIKIEYKEVPFKSKHSDVENPYSASCFICYNDFDEEYHLVAIKQCGHSCCSKCALKLKECSFCRTAIKQTDLIRIFLN